MIWNCCPKTIDDVGSEQKLGNSLNGTLISHETRTCPFTLKGIGMEKKPDACSHFRMRICMLGRKLISSYYTTLIRYLCLPLHIFLHEGVSITLHFIYHVTYVPILARRTWYITFVTCLIALKARSDFMALSQLFSLMSFPPSHSLAGYISWKRKHGTSTSFR